MPLCSRASSVTAEGLGDYKELIKTATDDLEAHLQSIDEKLETLFGHTVPESDADATELRLSKEERLSTQKCLQICAQLSDHIKQIQANLQDDYKNHDPVNPEPISKGVTTEGLQECRNSLSATTAKLENRMKYLIDRLVVKSKTTMTSEEEVADLVRLREEWETARQCMDICYKADRHLKENISVIDNYATGDAIQFMVSTDGRIINGTNRGLGWRTRQVGGHLSDTSLQQLSRDMSSASFSISGNEGASSRGNTPPVHSDVAEKVPSSEFKDRYGQGFKLVPKSTPDTPASPLRPSSSTNR